MMDDLRRLGITPRNPDGKAGPALSRSIPAALIQDLEWLRQRVLERLGALEALARQRMEWTTAAGGITALERTLQQRQAELEEAWRQVRAEAERQEKESSASLTQLEADRRLLAEAWERLERQRIDGSGASERHPHTHSPVQGQPRGTRPRCSTPPLWPRPDRPRPSRARITRSPRRSSDNSRPSPETCGAPPRRTAIPIEKGRRQAS